MNNLEILKAKVFAGAKAKKLVVTDEVLDRWSKELAVIEELGYTEYFLINGLIADVCNRNNWFRSPGFNTENSSLVNYCLDIVKVNPIAEKLLFEIFACSPFSPPHITNVISHGIQAALIEALKLELPDYNFGFKAFTPSETDKSDYERVMIEGTEYRKSPSTVIISHKSIQFNTSKFHVSGHDYYLLRDKLIDGRELVKYNYSLHQTGYNTKIELISSQLGEEHQPYNINLKDEAIYRFLSQKNSFKNLYLFDSYEYSGVLYHLRPTSIYDLAALRATCVKRSNEFVSQFLNTKNDGLTQQFPSDKRVDALLSDTYGVLVYCETIIQIANQIAGIALNEAEIHLNYIISNRKKEKVEEFYQALEIGCRKNSTLTSDDYAKLVAMIKQNLHILITKSHCLSSALISYWHTYYKVYFPELFDDVFSENKTILNR